MKNNSMIKIALTGDIPQGNLSPEDISTIPLYHLHHNLWDTLITTDKSEGVARSFSLSNDAKTYFFELSPDAKFSNGRSILASDVKLAFERLIKKEENGHINAKSVIDSIEVKSERKIEIHLKKPIPSFLFLLSTPEFGIVPHEAVDKNGNVISLNITSGAYVAKEVSFEKQEIILEKNPYFRRFSKSSPERVQISLLGSMDNFSEVIKKSYDFIEIRSSDAAGYAPIAEAEGYSVNTTAPSISVFLAANFKILDPGAARLISRAFQENFNFSNMLEVRSEQFFPPKTFGSLKQIPELEKAAANKLPNEIVIRSSRKTGALVDEIVRVFSRLGATVRFIDWNSKETFHYIFMGQGMNTEFPEIELQLTVLSQYSPIDASKSIKDMVEAATYEMDNAKRASIIQKIGTEFLTTGKIIPLTVRSYMHVFNSKRIDASSITKYDGDIPIYELQARE